MKPFTGSLINNCKQATFLMEKRQLASIGMRAELDLNTHLAVCPLCQIFEQQSVAINKLVYDLIKDEKLDNHFKKKMQDQIIARLEKNK